MTCGIALNIGSIVCSCVSTQKGTILKEIVVDFLNLLNRKGYRYKLVFLCRTSYINITIIHKQNNKNTYFTILIRSTQNIQSHIQ